MKPSGHFDRIPKCVSQTHSMSNSLKIDKIFSFENLFFIPLMFHVQIFSSVFVVQSAIEKTNYGRLRRCRLLTCRYKP